MLPCCIHNLRKWEKANRAFSICVSAALQWKELRNGRLALIALVGFAFQYGATGKGPLDNLIDHISDPSHINVATNGVSLPFVNPINSAIF